MKSPLGVELETYKNNKPRLLAESEGKYVLIKGKEVIGVYDTEDIAIQKGFDEYGYDIPILVRKITKLEPVIHVKGINVPCLTYEEDVTMAG